MHYSDIIKSTNSDNAIRRNVQNYDEDVATNKQSATGVKEFSPFNRIPCFHVTEGVSVDLDHDLLEGILHPSLAESILNFIDKKYFNLKFLNKRLKSMDFGEAENGNRPVNIVLKKLKNRKLQMTASEMFFFAHHLPLMIGDKVPEDDEVWRHVQTNVKFLDLCYLPKFDTKSIKELSVESNKLNDERMTLFNLKLQHKSHLITHYAELTSKLGPLRYLRTIR